MSDKGQISQTDQSFEAVTDGEANALNFSISQYIDDTLQITDVNVENEHNNSQEPGASMSSSPLPLICMQATSEAADSTDGTSVDGNLKLESEAVSPSKSLSLTSDENELPSSSDMGDESFGLSKLQDLSQNESYFNQNGKKLESHQKNEIDQNLVPFYQSYEKLESQQENETVLKLGSNGNGGDGLHRDCIEPLNTSSDLTNVNLDGSASSNELKKMPDLILCVEEIISESSPFRCTNENAAINALQNETLCFSKLCDSKGHEKEEAVPSSILEQNKLEENPDDVKPLNNLTHIENAMKNMAVPQNGFTETLDVSRSEDSSNTVLSITSSIDEVMEASVYTFSNNGSSPYHREVALGGLELHESIYQSVENENNKDGGDRDVELSKNFSQFDAISEDDSAITHNLETALNQSNSDELKIEVICKSSPTDTVNKTSVHTLLDEILCLSRIHDSANDESSPVDKNPESMKCQEKDKPASNNLNKSTVRESFGFPTVQLADNSIDHTDFSNKIREALDVSKSEVSCNNVMSETLPIIQLNRTFCCNVLLGNELAKDEFNPDYRDEVSKIQEDSNKTLNLSNSGGLCKDASSKSSSIDEGNNTSATTLLDETLCLSRLHDGANDESSSDLKNLESLNNQGKDILASNEVFSENTVCLSNDIDHSEISNKIKEPLNASKSEVLYNKVISEKSPIKELNETSTCSDLLDNEFDKGELPPDYRDESSKTHVVGIHEGVEFFSHSAAHSANNSSDFKSTLDANQSVFLSESSKFDQLNDTPVETVLLDETLCLSTLYNSAEDVPSYYTSQCKSPEKNESTLKAIPVESNQDMSLRNNSEQLSRASDLQNILIEDCLVHINNAKNESQSEPACDGKIKHDISLLNETLPVPKLHEYPGDKPCSEHIRVKIKDASSPLESLPIQSKQDESPFKSSNEECGGSFIETATCSSNETYINENNKTSLMQDMSITLIENLGNCHILECTASPGASNHINEKDLSDIKQINDFDAVADQKPGDALYVPTSAQNIDGTSLCETSENLSYMEITFANSNPIVLDQSLSSDKSGKSADKNILEENVDNTISHYVCLENDSDSEKSISDGKNNSHEVLQRSISDHVVNQHLNLEIPNSNNSLQHSLDPSVLDKSTDVSRLMCEQQTEHTLLMKWPAHYHAELEKLRSENKSLANDLESKTAAYNEVELNNAALNNALKEVSEKCDSFCKKISILEEALVNEHDNKNTISCLMKTNEKLVLEINSLKNIENLFEKLKANEDVLMNRIDSITLENERETQLLKEQINALEKDLINARNNEIELEVDNKLCIKVNCDLEETVEKLNKNIEELSHLCIENKQLKDSLKDQEQSKKDLESRINLLEEEIAVTKSQNEALWKGINQTSSNQGDLLALKEENFKLHENLTFYKSELAGLKFQCEIFTKDLESKNETIGELKMYKKKWKSSLINLNKRLNELEEENILLNNLCLERKEESDKIRLELENERALLQEELGSLHESICSLLFEKIYLNDSAVENERQIQELLKQSYEQIAVMKEAENERSLLKGSIIALEEDLASFRDSNNSLMTKLESSKKIQDEVHILRERNDQCTEKIKVLEKDVNIYQEEHEKYFDELRSLGETISSVIFSQDIETFENLTIITERSQQICELTERTVQLEELLQVEKGRVGELSHINSNLLNQLKEEREHSAHGVELELTIKEMHDYILCINEALLSEIFKCDEVNHENTALKESIQRSADEICNLKVCKHDLTGENEALKKTLDFEMSENLKVKDENKALIEAAVINKDQITSLQSENERLSVEVVSLAENVEKNTSKVIDLEKSCLENNNLKNTIISEINSLTSDASTNSYESCTISDVFGKLMTVFLQKEQEVISDLQSGYELKIKSLQSEVDLQNSQGNSKCFKLENELAECNNKLSHYQQNVELLEEEISHLQNELSLKIDEMHKIEESLLKARDAKESLIVELNYSHSKAISELEGKMSVLNADVINKDAKIADLLNIENSLRESEMVAKQLLEEKLKEVSYLLDKVEECEKTIKNSDMVISDLQSKESYLKQSELNSNTLMEEKDQVINDLKDKILQLTTSYEKSNESLQKSMSDLGIKTEMCSSMETQINCLNEQLKSHKMLYDEDTLQLKEQIIEKEALNQSLKESNLKLNKDFQNLMEKSKGFSKKEDGEERDLKRIKELEETIERGQQHYNVLKDVLKKRTSEIEGLFGDLKSEKDLNAQLKFQNDALITQNYAAQKELFELEAKFKKIERKLQTVLSSITILFPQEVSDDFKLENLCVKIKSLHEEHDLSMSCKNSNAMIKKLEENTKNILRRELDLKKQIASLNAALKKNKDSTIELAEQMYSLFSNSISTPSELFMKVQELINENSVLRKQSEGKQELEHIAEENKNLNEECEIMNKHIKDLQETLNTVLERENELKKLNSELQLSLAKSNSDPKDNLQTLLTLLPGNPSSLDSAVELIKATMIENSSLKEKLVEAKEDYASLDSECESMFKAYQEKEGLLNEVWKREEEYKVKEKEAQEEINRLTLELEQYLNGKSHSTSGTSAAKCSCNMLLASLRSDIAARDAKLTELKLQIEADSFPLRNTIASLETSLEQAKQRINELRGEVRRYQSQAQQDVTAQGLRTECPRCRDSDSMRSQIDHMGKELVILKNLCKTRKAKIAELEQITGVKTSSRSIRQPLKENLPSSSNPGSF